MFKVLAETVQYLFTWIIHYHVKYCSRYGRVEIVCLLMCSHCGCVVLCFLSVLIPHEFHLCLITLPGVFIVLFFSFSCVIHVLCTCLVLCLFVQVYEFLDWMFHICLSLWTTAFFVRGFWIWTSLCWISKKANPAEYSVSAIGSHTCFPALAQGTLSDRYLANVRHPCQARFSNL